MRWDPMMVPVTRRFLQEATSRSIEQARGYINKGVLLLARQGGIEKGKTLDVL